MHPIPPTNRLSPKNQVTLPRDAAALAGDPGHVRALPYRMPGKSDAGQTHPVLLLMTEEDLRKRERRIADDARIPANDKMRLIVELNAHAVALPIDDQRRVVLPAHLVDYLKLERDVLFVATGDLIYAWNPDEFTRWSQPAPAAGAPDLSTYLIV